MFRAWCEAGYIRNNPAVSHDAKLRGIDSGRQVSAELYDMVFEAMDAGEKPTLESRQMDLRDRFIFTIFRELGLHALELVSAKMCAFHTLCDPVTNRCYWVMQVAEETAQGSRERKLPVPRSVMDALAAYREVFAMPRLPEQGETHRLLLSPRTNRGATAADGRGIVNVGLRRDLAAWRPLTTRRGLHHIVTSRLSAAVDFLDRTGDTMRAEKLRQMSSHWLRLAFSRSTLTAGQDVRNVAQWLCHRTTIPTAVYTESATLEQIRFTNRVAPDLLAYKV
jgi:site-specific recombinase XerD